MTSVSPFSSTSLSLLVRISDLTPTGRQQAGNATDNILKAANGVSSEPSQGMKSATSAAGLLAVDLAEKSSKEDASSTDNDDGKRGKIIIGDLGSFDTFDEARAYVTNNDKFSTKDKTDWFAKLDQFEQDVNSAEEFRKSDLYKKIISGELEAQSVAQIAAENAGQMANGPDLLSSRSKIEELNNFMIEHGRQGLPNYDKLLERAEYA